jgi:hypothetical protein
MHAHRLFLATLLMVGPAMVEAQRGGGGSRGGGRGFGAAGGSREADALIRDLADSPSVSRDLQKQNLVEIILDKKKDLKLSSDEQKELKALASSLKESLKPYFKTIDSAQREQRKTGDAAPTQGQMIILRGVLREASDSVRVTYERVTPDVMAKLSEEHREPAAGIVKKELDEQKEARRNARGGRGPM